MAETWRDATLITIEGATHGTDSLTDLASSSTPARPRPREFSGRALVIGMVILGVVATVVMFVYWDQHTRPFRGLREAIGREFRHSRPNVEGGRHKGRGPKTLRISMSVEFPPAEDVTRGEEMFERVLEITRRFHDLHEFEKIEVNLIQIVPEEVAKVKTFTWPSDEVDAPEPSAKADQVLPSSDVRSDH